MTGDHPPIRGIAEVRGLGKEWQHGLGVIRLAERAMMLMSSYVCPSQPSAGIASQRPVFLAVEDRGSRLPPRDGVTLLRALVCLSIVAIHLQYVDAFHWPDWLTFLPPPSWFIVNVRLGFECFFVLAGYFLAHSFRPGPWKTFSVPSFYQRRLVRLLFPYWIVLLLTWLGFAFGSLRRHQPLSYPFNALWKQALCLHNFATDHIIAAQLWFMAPLIQFNLVWGIVFWMVRRICLRRSFGAHHALTMQIMTAVTIAAFVVSLYFADLNGDRGYTLAINAHYLALGCLLYWGSSSRTATVLSVVALSMEVALGWACGDSRPIAAVVTSLLLVYSAGRSFSAGPKLGWLKTIGHCSYSIYLTHIFVGSRVMVLLASWATLWQGKLVVWLIGVVGSVFGGYVFYRLVELPVSAWADKIQYRRLPDQLGG